MPRDKRFTVSKIGDVNNVRSSFDLRLVTAAENGNRKRMNLTGAEDAKRISQRRKQGRKCINWLLDTSTTHPLRRLKRHSINDTKAALFHPVPSVGYLLEFKSICLFPFELF
jgi:hypothetical protein